MEKSQKLKLVKDALTSYPDFPKPGVIFRDIFGIFRNAAAMQAMTDLILGHVALLDIELIVGLDSRGFLLGPLISLGLAKPFIPIRKKGKLPGKVIQQSYTMEYGEDTIEMQINDLHGKNKVLLVDDLIATGGTMEAAEKLVKSAGMSVVQCFFIVELSSLKGRTKLTAPVHSLIQYDS
ncbi:adenine phosphoribosyltransferase 1 isoform X1 [Copidosoma floridanum]|uniref:adenine phosphoribosyltransferase 1 isoform X1 n=1 Tax=Copidosoma floridanum TaxID=29053 RepID=UPI0006C94B0F|nr:adenine phosphoribosyltransferase 1 isoform X1 [Copidosoma floridanum]